MYEMPVLENNIDLVFSTMLRKAVLKHPFSLNRIANEAGITPPSLWYFMKQGRELQLKTARKLGDYLGVEEPEQGPARDDAERLLAMMSHHKAAVDFIEEQMAHSDDPRFLKVLREHRVVNQGFVNKCQAKIRELYPDLAIEE
jgi:hypothetical protein